MNITLVAKSFDPSRGGQEKYLNRLTDCFLDNQHRITVISERFGETEPDHPNLCFKRVFPLKPITGLGLLWFNWRARQISESIDSDLVFTTGKVSFGEFYRAGDGVHQTYLEQCVAPINRYKPKHIVQTYLQRKLFDETNDLDIMVNSKMVQDDILNRYDVSSNHIQVIYNGVDTETYDWKKLAPRRESLRSRHDLADDDFACLFTAGGWKRKGLPLVLETFASLSDSRVKLFVVGHTKETKLQETIRKYGLDEQVFYEGYVNEIEEYYAAADVLVFPSLYDAGASVVPEALASGLPVITTRWNGTHELVDVGDNGFVLEDEKSPEELKKYIERLRNMDGEKLRERAWQKGRQFTMDKHFSQVMNFIQER